MSVPGLTDPIGPDGVRTFAAAMLLLPLWYVVIEPLDRRSWTWPVLVGAIVLFVLLGLQDPVEPAFVLAGLALVGVVWGTVRGRLARPSFLLRGTPGRPRARRRRRSPLAGVSLPDSSDDASTRISDHVL